jgi:hypothetical protein
MECNLRKKFRIPRSDTPKAFNAHINYAESVERAPYEL